MSSSFPPEEIRALDAWEPEAVVAEAPSRRRPRLGQIVLRVVLLILVLLGVVAAAIVGYRWRTDAREFETGLEAIVDREHVDWKAAWDFIRETDRAKADLLEALIHATWFILGASALGVLGMMLVVLGRGKSAAGILLLAAAAPFALIARVELGTAWLTLLFGAPLALAGLLALLLRPVRPRQEPPTSEHERYIGDSVPSAGLDIPAVFAGLVAVLYAGAWATFFFGLAGFAGHKSTASPYQVLSPDELESRGRTATDNEKEIIAAHRRQGSVKLLSLKSAGRELAFSPDSRHLAVLRHNDAIETWDLPAAKMARSLEAREVIKIGYSPAGGKLFGATRNELRCWNPDSGESLGQWKLTHPLFWAISPDGSRLASINAIRDAHTAKGVKLFNMGRDGGVQAAAFSASGDRLAATEGISNRVAIWDMASGKKLRVVPLGPEGLRGDLFINALAFSPDGKTLAIAGSPNLLALVHVESGRVRKLAVNNSLSGAGFNHDGSILLATDAFHVRFWHVESGDEYELPTPVRGGPLAVSPGGLLFAAPGEMFDTIDVWKVPAFE